MKRVIEYYIRPARYLENGFEVVRPALSDPEYMGKYPECVKFMQNGLHERGVIYREKRRYSCR